MCSSDPSREDPRIGAFRAYTACGWRVVINHGVRDGVCTCGSREACSNPGKHPRGSGWLDAEATESDVRDLIQSGQEFNLGLLTGEGSGLLILDIDPRNGGNETLQQRIAELGPLPKAPTVDTGGGGVHIYFKCPRPELKSPSHGFGPGVDVRCKRAQAVTPPSMHGSGRAYAWRDEHTPDDVELPDLPQAWLDWLKAKAAPLPVQPPSPPAGPNPAEDDKVLQAAGEAANADKFEKLWSGMSPSGDRSADDLALCCMLAFWCRRDAEQMDRLFRRSQRMRAKWDEPHRGDGATYGRMTIETAIASCTEVYNGGGRHFGGGGTPGGNGTPAGTDPYHFNDLGNAKRLVDWFGQDFRHLHAADKWYAWDGRRWKLDDNGAVHRAARNVTERLWQTARGTKSAKDQFEWAGKSESQRGQRAMVELARDDQDVVITQAQLDQRDWLLNCRNGTIDLKSGQLQPHNRSDLVTCLAEADYLPEERAPKWGAFLQQTFLGNPDLIRYVQQVLGYGITGAITDQYLWLFVGMGNNGKNVLLDTVQAVLGDYAARAAPDLLTASNTDRHPTEVADLAGKRLVLASETDEGKRLNVSLMKQMTGDATLKARRMREDFWEFQRTFKLVVATNNLPRVREESHAVWRRLRVVPFDYTVPPKKIDKDLPQKLLAERDGILAWLVRGCLDWQQNGLVEPQIVKVRSAEYRQREDMVGDFVGDACTLDVRCAVTNQALMIAYAEWCKKQGLYPMSKNALLDRIRALPGVRKEKTGPSRGVLGLGLTGPVFTDLPPDVRSVVRAFGQTVCKKQVPSEAFWDPNPSA